MNVLIIGGAGYIGSHQVKVMCEKGYNVIVLDSLITGYVSAVDKKAKFIEGDVRNFDLVKSVLSDNKIDAVIHFAALSLVGESVTKPLEYYDNNVYGMQILLRAMVETKVDKIVFSSSAAVYGEHEVMPINEEYSNNPSSPYGETKLAMEKMIKWVSKAHGIKYVSLRYFNACGADESGTIGENHNPETHLIPIILQVALKKRESISIYGDDYETPDGTCIRDYIHVLDLCEAHILAVDKLDKGMQSNTFNLGYNNGYSVKEIIEATKKVTGKDIKYSIEDRRSGDPAKLVAANEKIKRILGWEPHYDDIELIIQTAYNYYLKSNNE